jgi:hypothetical protein
MYLPLIVVDQLTLPLGIVTTLIRGDAYAWGQTVTARC